MIEILKRDTLVSLRAEQKKAFHTNTPGVWFEDFTQKIDKMADDDIVLGFGLDSDKVMAFNKNGDPIAIFDPNAVNQKQKNVFLKHRGWADVLRDSVTKGCVPCVAEVDNVRYGAGLAVIAGRGDVGKTPFVHAFGDHLAGDSGYAVVRFGEPLSGYDSNFESFVRDIAEAMLKHKIIVIDSLKDVIASIGGNATTGGFSRGAFQLLSDLGSMATTRGCMVMASVNPTSNDDKLVDLLNEVSRSNATTLVVADPALNQWNVITRTGEGLQRVNNVLTSRYTDDLVMEFEKPNKAPKSGKLTQLTQTVVTSSDLESIIRRLLPTTN